jgi:hypothetical protein
MIGYSIREQKKVRNLSDEGSVDGNREDKCRAAANFPLLGTAGRRKPRDCLSYGVTVWQLA